MGPSLRTARLLLVPFRPSDVDSLLAFFNDPDVGRYLLDGTSVSRQWVEQEVRESRRRFAGESAGLWTIRTLTDGAEGTPDEVQAGSAAHLDVATRPEAAGPIHGVVGYRPFFDPPELQLLYALAPSAWGQGIATEAARGAIDHAFSVRGFDEVRAATDAPNTASIAVLERLGMTRWKTEPGDPWDTLFYRVRSSSWR